MDNRRLFLAIAVSIVILLGYQLLVRPHLPQPPLAMQSVAAGAAGTAASGTTGSQTSVATTIGSTAEDAGAPPVAPVAVPRVTIDAPRVLGSISLLGARLDDVVLRDYRETIDPKSPQVRLLEPPGDPLPYFMQFGWTAPPGSKLRLPDNNTVWTASAPRLTATAPVTLSWDNGAGLVFRIVFTIDDNYMFGVQQSVHNASGEAVSLFPWARIRRDYTPVTAGYYILHEGPIGVLDGRLEEMTYAQTKSTGLKHDGLAYSHTGDGGWSGITDKYWLTALIPDRHDDVVTTFNLVVSHGRDGTQTDFMARAPQVVAPGATATSSSRAFAGAKEVHLLDRYEAADHIPSFDKAVDFGWFYFLTKPIFYALDWLNGVLGNFGLAIMAFTVAVKLLFFPLANKSYRSMSKMKLLGPKLAAMRERLKDEPGKQQAEMMAIYRAEKVNPASGCLPMLIQIPVFFSLYKVIFVTIEMRQAPFFGWIHDLSAVDPTNLFNLFGLLPFHPSLISPFLHLGIWPIIMGATMFFQQKLNPPPPDPVQARLFQFMPLIFTFMLARFPAGLVIYWSWNNTLTIVQQWYIMRSTRLEKPKMARG